MMFYEKSVAIVIAFCLLFGYLNSDEQRLSLKNIVCFKIVLIQFTSTS